MWTDSTGETGPRRRRTGPPSRRLGTRRPVRCATGAVRWKKRKRRCSMTTLMPRFFGELFDWFEAEPLARPGQMIRIEDRLSETEYVVRAELPGCDPQKEIQVTAEHGVLTIKC